MVIRLIAGLILLPILGFSQLGGQNSFNYVNIPSNARLVGLGGVNVSLADEDINLAFSNPALNGDTLSGLASFSYLDYFADVSVLTAIYQHDFGKAGSWFIGVNHVNYGSFDSYDASGTDLGTFNAGDTQIILGRSHTIGVFRIGASLKFLNSSIGGFSSSAMALDLGGTFKHPKKQFTAALVLKNLGAVISDYTITSNSELPFDVQLGMTFKPEHMPVRFTLTGYNLTDGNISYFNSNPIFEEEKPGDLDNALRHLNVGAELLLTKNINIRFGYNHLVRQELKLPNSGGGAGFSYGLMFRVKAFEFAYGRGGYHAAGGSNNFTLTMNTNRILKKRKG